MRRYLSLLFLINFVNVTAPAADWPCWRGPNGLGVSSEKDLPVSWSKENNVAWTVSVPGTGASSPIIVGDRVYLTSQTSDTGLHVIAIDRKTGAVAWDREIAQGKLKTNNLHNMATPTPASDGAHIWVLFGTGDVACLDADGKLVWHRNLVKEYGEYRTNHGMGTSPMLFEDKLYIACMHQGPSYVLALNAANGDVVWKKDRNLPPKDESQDSYSSPIFVATRTGTQLVLAGAEHVNAYAPATGEQLWVCGGFRVATPNGRTIAGPTAGGDSIIAVASGFGNLGYTVALKTGGKGDITESHRQWTSKKFSPDCPTPVVYGNKVFQVRDDGLASCLDLKSGEADWQERLFSANVKVSPVAADSKIYFMNGNGSCTVVKAAPRLEILATNDLKETTLSTPAISHGQLFVRTQGHLYCVVR